MSILKQVSAQLFSIVVAVLSISLSLFLVGSVLAAVLITTGPGQ